MVRAILLSIGRRRNYDEVCRYTEQTADGETIASPVYDSLTTNLPHPLMSFHDFPFPAETPLYPPASTVQGYILSYAEHFGLRQYIQLNKRVKKAVWLEDAKEWEVSSEQEGEVEVEVRRCDKLIVANGHYSRPHIPLDDLQGLADERWLGKWIHSGSYRNPLSYAGKKVLVIGGGPSGQDISREIGEAAREVLWSVRGFERDNGEGGVRKRGAVQEFAHEGVVKWTDQTQNEVDFVVLATGYQFE